MEKVVDKFISELSERTRKNKVHISLSAPARKWLALKGYDPRYGARPLSRLIQTEIKDRLSEEVLFGRLSKGGRVTISLKDDRLSFEYSPSN